jgi:hypothetical protein
MLPKLLQAAKNFPHGENATSKTVVWIRFLSAKIRFWIKRKQDVSVRQQIIFPNTFFNKS